MPLHRIAPMFTALVLAVVLAPVAIAEPPADKGKGASAAQGQPGGKSQAEPYPGTRDDDAKGKVKSGDKDYDHGDDANHGQVVSECNHRANDKKLKGKDRQDYLEWCTDHGERYKYDDRRYDQDRSCYRKADDKGLSGDFRRVFIQECLRKQEKNR